MEPTKKERLKVIRWQLAALRTSKRNAAERTRHLFASLKFQNEIPITKAQERAAIVGATLIFDVLIAQLQTELEKTKHAIP